MGDAWKSLSDTTTASKIEGTGLGVISKTFIPKYMWLAEYEGFTLIPDEKDYISDYTWIVGVFL